LLDILEEQSCSITSTLYRNNSKSSLFSTFATTVFPLKHLALSVARCVTTLLFMDFQITFEKLHQVLFEKV